VVLFQRKDLAEDSYNNWFLLYLKNMPIAFGRNDVRTKKEPPSINKS